MSAGLRVLVVDDESLARSRLLGLLETLKPAVDPVIRECREASSASAALAALAQSPADVLLLDIRMPGLDGLALAQQLRRMTDPPDVVFVTAHGEHALQAFELEAADYLTKPVRLERLQAALRKVAQRRRWMGPPEANDADFLLIEERGQLHRVPLSQVLCVRAELKYLTVHTAMHTYLHDESLQALEDRYPAQLLRVHRSTLVARDAMRQLERRIGDAADGDSEVWLLHLAGLTEPVPVSRRQLSSVREAMRQR